MSELITATIGKNTIDDALKVVKKIPFKIIMTDEGESICATCKHKQKGKHQSCKNQVDYYKKVVWERETKESEYVLKKNHWNNCKPEETIVRGEGEVGKEWFVGGYEHENKFKHIITESYKDDCRGTMSWDKQYEVEEHNTFFNLIYYVNNLQTSVEHGNVWFNSINPNQINNMMKLFNKHFDLFKPEDMLRLNTVLMLHITTTLASQSGALNQMANKMHAAGNNLAFNN